MERKMTIINLAKLSRRVLAFLCLGVLMLFSCATLPAETSTNEVVVPQINPPVESSPLPAPPVKTQNVPDEKTEVAAEVRIPPAPAPAQEACPANDAAPPSVNDKSTVTEPSQPLRPVSVITAESTPKRDLAESSLADNETAPAKVKNSTQDENVKDIMEEALVLLDESHKHWAKGGLDEALQMLDQAYALLLDANGNPDIARQKDDLRLIISKRILAIYNSLPTVAKGQRGEIPIVSNADVEKEIHSFQNYERDFFISSYQRSLIYRPGISAELKKAGLPDELSWLPLVESGYKVGALSSARALGLWQFIPSTGYKYGLNRDDWVDERMDIEKSTRAAIAYLQDLHAMFGDWLTVLAGYNCGEYRIMRTIASQQINYLDRFWDLYQKLPNETARYVPRFIATLLIVKDPAKYGFDFAPEQNKCEGLAYETVDTEKSMRLQDIAAKLDISADHLCILNAELRRKTTPNRPYKLKVPTGAAENLLRVVAEIPNAEIHRASYRTARGVFIKHTVRKGDTLASLAEKYKTSVSSIRSANKLSKKGLYAGQKLNIPVTTASVPVSSGNSRSSEKVSVYKVKKGDTLSAIASKYSVSVAALKKINNLKNDELKIGQTLRLTQGEDEGRKAAAPPPKENKAAARTYGRR
jgi:membrane-bound lytic murein transglycosylase D